VTGSLYQQENPQDNKQRLVATGSPILRAAASSEEKGFEYVTILAVSVPIEEATSWS
jgi:hypothetical protein